MALRLWLLGLALVLALPCPARAEAPKEFAQLRDRAQALESLSAFLERFVGSCTDLVEKKVCESNARKARAELTGKLFVVTLDDSAARMLKAGSYNPGTREFTVEMTPFFEGAGLALTDGPPLGQDAQGRPRVPIKPIVAKLPPDWMPMDMERLLRTQNVKVHLVFKPLGLWSLPAKSGGPKMDGVNAKFLAVRLTNARDGEDLALRLEK